MNAGHPATENFGSEYRKVLSKIFFFPQKQMPGGQMRMARFTGGLHKSNNHS